MSSRPSPAFLARLRSALVLRFLGLAAVSTLGAPVIEALEASGLRDEEFEGSGALLLVEFLRFGLREFEPSRGALGLAVLACALLWLRAPVELGHAARGCLPSSRRRALRWRAERVLLRGAGTLCVWMLAGSSLLRWSRYGGDAGTVALVVLALGARPLTLLLETKLAVLSLEGPSGGRAHRILPRWSEVRSLATLGLLEATALLLALAGAFAPEALFSLAFVGVELALVGVEFLRLGHWARLASASDR